MNKQIGNYSFCPRCSPQKIVDDHQYIGSGSYCESCNMPLWMKAIPHIGKQTSRFGDDLRKLYQEPKKWVSENGETNIDNPKCENCRFFHELKKENEKRMNKVGECSQ